MIAKNETALAENQKMEQIVTMEEKRNRDNAVRAVIRTARERLGLQEKEVNQLFHEGLRKKGVNAPRAIMTRVRDKRRPLEFSKAEAMMLAAILKIDASPLMPRETQASLLIDEGEERITHKETQVELPRVDPPHFVKARGDEMAFPAKTQERANSRSKNEITIAPSGKELELRIDYVMTNVQLDRFTLAIPIYMVEHESTPDGIRVRGKVNIFPYQAELIMRAIFGRR